MKHCLNRLCFPEIIDNPFTLEEPSERHLHRHPYFDPVEIVVGQFADQPSTSIEIDNPIETGRIFCGLQLIHRIGEEPALLIRELVLLERIFRLARHADSHGLARSGVSAEFRISCISRR